MVGEGRTVSTFHRNETVFAQGEKADKVFYIQKGSVKVVVLSEQGKEAGWSGFSSRGSSSAKAA